jgi:hypothetical protein
LEEILIFAHLSFDVSQDLFRGSYAFKVRQKVLLHKQQGRFDLLPIGRVGKQRADPVVLNQQPDGHFLNILLL